MRQIAEDLKTAMRLKDGLVLNCLRILKTSVKNKQIEKCGELHANKVRIIISSLIKKGTEAASRFGKANLEDLASKEDHEINILHEYLPEQFNHDEIEKILLETITELSTENEKDPGKVMKTAIARMTEKIQGREVNAITRRLLNNPL